VRVAIITSASGGTPWAKATVPCNAEYALRHGYSLLVKHETYERGLAEGLHGILRTLDEYDLVWTLDADCLVTNHTLRIEDVPGLGEHVTLCEEGIMPRNRFNCGSMVWRDTDGTRGLIHDLIASEEEWRNPSKCEFIWQSWLANHAEQLGDTLTVLPQRAFNSVAWEHSGGGCLWQPGDFVYHPCGFDHANRLPTLERMCGEVVR